MPPRNNDERTSSGPKRSEQAHQAILDATEEILMSSGRSALTYEAIAKKAKAGKATIYRWWPNKFSLILEVYHRTKFRVIHIPDTGSIKSDLEDYTRQLWTYWRETPGGSAFRTLLIEAQSSKATQDVLATKFYESKNEQAPSMVMFKRAVERGEISKSIDLVELRKMYISINWFHLLCNKLEDLDIKLAVDMLINSLIQQK